MNREDDYTPAQYGCRTWWLAQVGCVASQKREQQQQGLFSQEKKTTIMENFMPYYIWGLQPHHLFRKQANQSSPFHLCTALYSDAKFYTAINQWLLHIYAFVLESNPCTSSRNTSCVPLFYFCWYVALTAESACHMTCWFCGQGHISTKVEQRYARRIPTWCAWVRFQHEGINMEQSLVYRCVEFGIAVERST